MPGTILRVFLIPMLLGALPALLFSPDSGYAPAARSR